MGYEFFIDRFYFSSLKMLLPCLLACIVSGRKFAVILLSVPLYSSACDMSFFSGYIHEELFF